MPGIEMERAFSALASPVRLPSPLGWAGMMGAFGAPRFAGPVAMALDANPKCPNSRGRMQCLFSASHLPGVGTDAAVSQSRQRLECGDLSPFSSASASQLAADSPVRRAKAPTSWRTCLARQPRIRQERGIYPAGTPARQIRALKFQDPVDDQPSC